jgi:Ion channel
MLEADMTHKINLGGKGPLAFTRRPLLSLLIALLALLLLYPFFAGSVMAHAFWDICSSAVLLLGIYTISRMPRHVVIAAVFGIVVLGTRWSGYVIDNEMLLLVNYGLAAIFFIFTACLLLGDVLRKGAVTADKIYGALCVYLLIGLTWGFIFLTLEGVQPGSFQFGQAWLSGIQKDPATLVYFSFVTLSTVGYGDITPLSPPARSFAFMEAIIGQIYLAVLVARLVGLHIAYSMAGDP